MLGAECLGRWLLGEGVPWGGAPAPCKQQTPSLWLGGGGCHTQHHPGGGGGSWLCFPAGCGPPGSCRNPNREDLGDLGPGGAEGEPCWGCSAGGCGPELLVRGRGDAAGFVPGLPSSRRGKPQGTPVHPSEPNWKVLEEPPQPRTSPCVFGGRRGIFGAMAALALPGGGRGLGRSRAAVGTLLSVWAALRGRLRREDCSPRPCPPPPPMLFRSPELWEPFV